MRSLSSRTLVGAVVLSIAGVACAATAATFPALDRPAIRVRSPDRSALLSATMAGLRIVAVGERGVVALSDDLAAHWRQARSVPVSVTLTSVQFIDARRGWAVGHGGVILHTDDGGESWERQADGRTLAQAELTAAQAESNLSSAEVRNTSQRLKAAQRLVDDGPDKPLLDVYFADAVHGYAVGAYNLFFETQNGGRSWKSAMDRLENPKALNLYAVKGQGADVFIAGEQGTLHRSTDAGRHFGVLASPYEGSWFTLALTSQSIVVAGLRGSVYRSEDQGDHWARIESPASASFIDAAMLPGGGLLLVNQAGQVFASRDRTKLAATDAPPLPQPAQLLPLPDGSLLAVGLAGAMRLPATDATRGGAQ